MKKHWLFLNCLPYDKISQMPRWTSVPCCHLCSSPDFRAPLYNPSDFGTDDFPLREPLFSDRVAAWRGKWPPVFSPGFLQDPTGDLELVINSSNSFLSSCTVTFVLCYAQNHWWKDEPACVWRWGGVDSGHEACIFQVLFWMALLCLLLVAAGLMGGGGCSHPYWMMFLVGSMDFVFLHGEKYTLSEVSANVFLRYRKSQNEGKQGLLMFLVVLIVSLTSSRQPSDDKEIWSDPCDSCNTQWQRLSMATRRRTKSSIQVKVTMQQWKHTMEIIT